MRAQAFGGTNSIKEEAAFGFSCLKEFLPWGGNVQRGCPLGGTEPPFTGKAWPTCLRVSGLGLLGIQTGKLAPRGNIGFLEHSTIDWPGYSLPVVFQVLKC